MDFRIEFLQSIKSDVSFSFSENHFWFRKNKFMFPFYPLVSFFTYCDFAWVSFRADSTCRINGVADKRELRFVLSNDSSNNLSIMYS